MCRNPDTISNVGTQHAGPHNAGPPRIKWDPTNIEKHTHTHTHTHSGDRSCAAVAPLCWASSSGRGLPHNPANHSHPRPVAAARCSAVTGRRGAMLSSGQHMGLLGGNISWNYTGWSLWDTARLDLSDAHLTMVSIDHVAHKILTYIPYVLVLIDMRYEGKKLSLITRQANDSKLWGPLTVM